MAENLPINFAVPGENVIATYNYQELAEGTGILSLYPFYATMSGGTIIYRLSSNTYFSESNSTGGTTGGALVFNKTFELNPFNTPRTVKGTAIFTLPFIYGVSHSDQVLHISGALAIKKESAGVTTTIVERTIEKTGATGVSIGPMNTWEISIPEAHFKIDDKLKIQFQLYCDRISGTTGAPYYEIGHSPKAVDSTYIKAADGNSTQMRFDIPFAIQL